MDCLEREGVRFPEAHVLLALSWKLKPEEFGRTNICPPLRWSALSTNCAARHVDCAGSFTDTGRAITERIEVRTDETTSPAHAAHSAPTRSTN